MKALKKLFKPDLALPPEVNELLKEWNSDSLDSNYAWSTSPHIGSTWPAAPTPVQPPIKKFEDHELILELLERGYGVHKPPTGE